MVHTLKTWQPLNILESQRYHDKEADGTMTQLKCFPMQDEVK